MRTLRMPFRPAALLLVPVVALAAAGCGGGSVGDAVTDAAGEAVAEAAVEAAAGGGDVEIDEEAGSVEVNSDGGRFTAQTGGDVPEEWPADVPTYDGGTLESSSVAAGEAGSDMVIAVTYSTDESGEEVIERMRSRLEDAGFRSDGDMNMSGGGGGLWIVVAMRDAITYSLTITGGAEAQTMVVTGITIEGGA